MRSQEYRNQPLFLRNQFSNASPGVFEMPMIVDQGELDPGPVELIGYDHIKAEDAENKGKYVHFFLDDYKFEALWKDPLPRLSKLAQYKGVLSPQFSAYIEMPYPLQLYNTFRSRWVGAWLQHHGLRVIPTVYWGLPQTYWYCFDGVVEGSVVAVSMIGVRREQDFFMQGYLEMVKRLGPRAVICYGEPFPEMEGTRMPRVIPVDYAATNRLGLETGDKAAIRRMMREEQAYLKRVSGVVVAYRQMGYGSAGGGNQRKGMPKDHRVQNKQVDDVVKKLKLNKNQRRELHDLIHGMDYNYQDILKLAKEWFGL